MANCLTCGGLIMEPGLAYQYSGPVCNCIPEIRSEIRYQRRDDIYLRNAQNSLADFGQLTEKKITGKEVKRLMNFIDNLTLEELQQIEKLYLEWMKKDGTLSSKP